ncbi:probable disease resistance protein RPP1 [Solanum stenotomum]|uniref:probable disease resistance protein RPP1 n=1 Tax=Solanum stenotomum TaxID=172797 RepID=UPI0020D0C6DD|nr:probable disease resistance protein RPP1 [Solanum stenotomum]
MPSLSYLDISQCPKLISVPTGGLHCLTGLRILEMEIGPFSEMVDFEAFQLIFNGIQQLLSLRLYGVEISNIASSNNTQVFPSLKELVLEDMCSLIEWKGDEVGARMFPRLEKLRIKDCPLLKSTPTQFEILRELSIEGVDSEMPLLNLCSNLTSLVDLYVSNVKELTCLPDEMLRNNVSLQYISVFDCRDFREFPQSLYNLHSLERLMIASCTNFSSFPVPSGDNYLTSLQLFQLWYCDGFISLPSGMLDQCRSLAFLNVSNCNNLVSLPLHVCQMPLLLYLKISLCSKLGAFTVSPG